jgi:hypothetical protein
VNYERWETPVSDARSLALVSLIDRDGLHVTLQDLRDPGRRRFEFTFRRVPAYRNILEEYRLGESGEKAHGAGWTTVVSQSVWLAELRARESLLDVHSPGCRHFCIETEDDVLDILTPEAPEIREVAPSPPNEPLPGKSRILYDPDDRDEIERVLGPRPPTPSRIRPKRSWWRFW